MQRDVYAVYYSVRYSVVDSAEYLLLGPMYVDVGEGGRVNDHHRPVPWATGPGEEEGKEEQEGGITIGGDISFYEWEFKSGSQQKNPEGE